MRIGVAVAAAGAAGAASEEQAPSWIACHSTGFRVGHLPNGCSAARYGRPLHIGQGVGRLELGVEG